MSHFLVIFSLTLLAICLSACYAWTEADILWRVNSPFNMTKYGMLTISQAVLWTISIFRGVMKIVKASEHIALTPKTVHLSRMKPNEKDLLKTASTSRLACLTVFASWLSLFRLRIVHKTLQDCTSLCPNTHQLIRVHV